MSIVVLGISIPTCCALFLTIQQNTDRIHSIQCSRILHLHAFEDDVVKNQKAKTVWCENKKTLISHSTLYVNHIWPIVSLTIIIIILVQCFTNLFFGILAIKLKEISFLIRLYGEAAWKTSFRLGCLPIFCCCFSVTFKNLLLLYVMICFH